MSNIYWVGPRQSDIEIISQLFKGSVTIYGNSKNGNIAYCHNHIRINHNIDNKLCDDFMKLQLENIIKEDAEACFLFYNQEYAYHYGENIISHSIGLNEHSLLMQLNNKAECRFMLSDVVDVIPCVALKGKNCNLENLKKMINTEEFVLQKVVSSGGDGTFHIAEAINDLKNVCVDENDDYIVSAYLQDGIPINIHLLITDQEVFSFPASIQIIYEYQSRLLYSGADYICFNYLDREIKERIAKQSIKIGEFLQKKGYRGILGIDYMLWNNQVYFMELNPRFQASTELLNRAFCQKSIPSLQEMCLDSINGKEIVYHFDGTVNFSNFVYSINNITNPRLEKILNSKEIFQIQLDGYCPYNSLPAEENSYICRCIFTRNICSISHGKIILHPNIYIENIKSHLKSDNKYYKAYIKFALLNHGTSLSEKAKRFVENYGIIKEAVFDAIDITIFEKIKVNVPISCKFNSISPFTIDERNGSLVLLFENKIVTEVQIELIPESLADMKTSSGIPYEAFINIATDRIRVNPAPICIYKTNGNFCHFCNLPEENYQYDINDIFEAVDYCISHVDFRHFLIGGGTYSVRGGWDIIINICQYIRSKCSKNIYLMSIPPEDIKVLDDLKRVGITEVAFNIEIFDRKLARQIMPGKGNISLERYFNAFEHAVKLWGATGSVRSLLIYGLDTDDLFIKGIEKLCSYGVEPIISIFRPLSNTLMENSNPPKTLDVFAIYEQCKAITEKFSLILGPDCTDCQNNTLSYPK